MQTRRKAIRFDYAKVIKRNGMVEDDYTGMVIARHPHVRNVRKGVGGRA